MRLKQLFSPRHPMDVHDRLDEVKRRLDALVGFLMEAEGKPRRETWVSSRDVQRVLDGEEP